MDDTLFRLIQGSAHHIDLPDQSVHCLVTSPPYFGLRAYAGEQDVEWPTVTYAPMPGLSPIVIQGCEPGCEHEWTDHVVPAKTGGPCVLSGAGKAMTDARYISAGRASYCTKCGGWRGGLGAEPTVEAYIGHLILCLREWWRVLRDDGTAWVNLGSSYVSTTEDLYTLRNDLTPEERDYVLAELAACKAL